jgi:DNA-binding transcriptional MerR regulator
MEDERPDVLTIGRLAQRTGLPVRTLRFWSDEGAVPPVARSASGYRLYDAASVARVELVRTLRELGLGLDDVCSVLSGRTTVAEFADAHVAAIDAQIRSLKVSRAVLSAVAKRGSTAEETALMNRLTRLSTAERKQIIDEFKEEVFGGLDVEPRLRDRMRTFGIELPDDPTPEQVDAWIELAELVRDPGFRTGARSNSFRFCRTGAPYATRWNVHRHRMAPVTAEAVCAPYGAHLVLSRGGAGRAAPQARPRLIEVFRYAVQARVDAPARP